MTTPPTRTSGPRRIDDHAGGNGLSPDGIFESKLRPPVPRPGIIERTALVDHVLNARHEPVVSVVAPPGYGKTTLLAQWAARQERDLAWVSLDAIDNDPKVLLIEAATALSRVELVDPGLAHALNASAASVASDLARVSSALSSSGKPVAMVFDHVESIDNRESLDVVAEFAHRLPAGSQLALTTRQSLPMSTALLRSRGELLEIGVDDLAMDDAEARMLVAGAGVELSNVDMAMLIEQTEGWPVGLYLGALAAKQGRRPSAPGAAVTGDDRLIGDYLRSELLARLDPDTICFLTRTSILDRLSAPLCDAVLDCRGSQRVLESIEASNLLVVPLDRRREWYRYHRLFREMLLNDLRRNEPDLVPELHARAAVWFEDHAMPESAIPHAQSADDADRVARLVVGLSQPAYAAGRADTARAWFEWFDGSTDQYPQIAIMRALLEALLGHPAGAEQWSAAAEAADVRGLAPDGSPMTSWLAYLRALTCPDGLAMMRVDAVMARDHLAPTSPFRAGALLLEALTYLLEGEPDVADPILAHAVDVAVHVGAMPVGVAALAERAVIAIGRGEWYDAQELSDRAVGIIESAHLDGYMQAALVEAVAARLAARRGDHRAAKEHVIRSARLRPLLTYAVPYSAQFLLELARAYLELADPIGARAVVRQIRDILHQRPALGVLPRLVDELQATLDVIRVGSVGVSSLTTAELRLLPSLSTHLSFREIGERFNVSRHTVKTQAISVYRKLGVSSRSEAIERMREFGLHGI